MSKLGKIKKSEEVEEVEDYIPSEGDSDHELDDIDEVFLQVRVMVFCICI